jgi:hypothetical protein
VLVADGDYRQGARRLIPVRPNSNAQALPPGPLSQFSHILFTAPESIIAVFGVQQECLKIAEAVKNEPSNFAAEGATIFVVVTRVMSPMIASPWLAGHVTIILSWQTSRQRDGC